MKFESLPREEWQRWVDSAIALIRNKYVPEQDEIKLAEKMWKASQGGHKEKGPSLL